MRAGSIKLMKQERAKEPKPEGASKDFSKSIDQYIAAVPEPARTMLKKMRVAIRSALPPEATEVISYRIPAFKLKKVLVWFAAFKDHCSLFPTAAVIDEFRDELQMYTISKGTIQFPFDKPLPETLIKKLVRARLNQSGGKARE